MKFLSLTILSLGMVAPATQGGGSGTILDPPIPGALPALSGGLAGRQAPPVQRSLPPGPPPPPVSSTLQPPTPRDDDRASLVVRRFTIRPGERVTVMTGPGAVVPGTELLDARLAADAAPRHVLLAVAAVRDTERLPALVIVRS